MSIGRKTTSAKASITGPEKMYGAVMRLGIVPFFENVVPGYSIEEMTAEDHWFGSDDMGPWDWKIDLVRSGDIAYGKFLLGGKAAFATERCYRALMSCRRADPRFSPTDPDLLAIMRFVEENGSVTVRDVRELLGIKKSKADALLTRLQMDTLLITGDITRVYRGADLHYEGWQRTSFCRPDDFFDASPADFFNRGLGPLKHPSRPHGPFQLLQAKVPGTAGALQCAENPMHKEDYDYLVETIRRAAPGVDEKAMHRILGL